MDLLTIQLTATALTIVWFEIFNFGFTLKMLLYKNVEGWYNYKKPFDCRLCTHFWLGSVVSAIYFFIHLDASLLVASLSLNTLISYIYERVQTIQND